MSQPPLNPNLGNPLARLVIALVAVVTMVGTHHALAADGSPLDREPPPNDPCALLKISEMQQVFPQAVKMKRDDNAEFMGISTCIWTDAKGQPQLGLNLEHARNKTVEGSLALLAFSMRDPAREDLLEHSTRYKVRYERLIGVGDEAMAAVERADSSAGILTDFAFLVTRRDVLLITLGTVRDLPQRDRTAALSALSKLGKTAAQRI